MGGDHDGRVPVDNVVPSPKDEDVVSKSNMKMMIDLWPVVTLLKRELIVMEQLVLQQGIPPLRALMALVVKMKLRLHHVDVKMKFLKWNC